MVELKACPFCGDIPKLNKCTAVSCGKQKRAYQVYCGGCLIGTEKYFKEEIATDRWNRRVNDGQIDI